MNTELLLREFDRLSEAPDTVSRLRAFIRDLAIAGRFDDRESKAEVVCVRDVADCRLGKMLDKTKNRGSLRRYLRNANVRWNAFDLSDVKEMRFEDTEINEFTLRVGDVLVCEGGEPGRAAVWDRQEEGILFQKAIHRVRLANSVDPHYFVLALRQAADSGRLAEYFTGTTFKHLTGMGLARFSFPLPPFAEQQRIVAKVGELTTLCDELETARKQRERQRKQLSAASLARLTAPEDAPGKIAEKDVTFFLSHSSRMVTQSAHVADVRRAVLDLAVQGQLHGEDAREWPKRTVAEVLDSLQTGPFGSSLHQTDYESGGTPVINPASIQDGRIIPIPKMAVGPATLDRLASFKVSSNDVVMARRGEMGRCAVVTPREHGWLCGTGCLVLHPAQAIFPDYLAMFIGAPRTRQYLNSASVGTTMQNLNQRILLELEVVVPPFEEQQRIVTKVDEIMTVCDELERSLDAAQAVRTRALEAILHRVLEEAGAALPVLLEVVG